jgi:hypothetical protein
VVAPSGKLHPDLFGEGPLHSHFGKKYLSSLHNNIGNIRRIGDIMH